VSRTCRTCTGPIEDRAYYCTACVQSALATQSDEVVQSVRQELDAGRVVIDVFLGILFTGPARHAGEDLLDRYPCPSCGASCAVTDTGEVFSHRLGTPPQGDPCPGGTVDPVLRAKDGRAVARRRLVEELREAGLREDDAEAHAATEALATYDDLAARSVPSGEANE